MDGIHKGRKRWEKESCEQHSFSHWVLMRLHMIRDRERDKSRRTNLTQPHLTNHLLSFSKNCWQAHSAALIQIISARRSPTFTRRNAHLEDVVSPTRQRWKTFCNRLTGPQLGAKNSKPWRNSVTSPKARHLNPLFLHFRLRRS